MIVLFEDFYYDAEILSKLLPTELLRFSPEGTQAKTTYVGYHFCQKVSGGTPVFILPKVFVTLGSNQQNCPLGREDVSLETFLQNERSLSDILGEEDARIVSRLSFWIYMAISKYASKRLYTEILINRDIQEVKSVGEYACTTLLEIIQSLRKFNKDHQNLFTFIAKSNRSGMHKIHWQKTISKFQPFFQQEEPLYLQFFNKKKFINFDEELIVIFFSVLEYLKEKYFFDETINLNFNLIPTYEVENLIETGMGTILLNKLRHKYFTDELVTLWHLLYVFFDKAERIANKDYIDEFVLATSFNNVFEDMIDQLIGSNELANIKQNKDGKIIDHLYKDKALINNGDTYFIADSKYYKERSDLGENSVYKQFTYARNIIQYNLNIFQSGGDGLPSMRDELTEGYNILPNFFIRGSAVGTNGLYNYEDDCLTPEFENVRKDKHNKLVNYHFSNRLFDRDTLVLQTYNINFLYVLAKYVEGEDQVVKEKIRRVFRNNLVERFDQLYFFYELSPCEGKTIEEVVERNFRRLIGKVIRPRENQDSLIFAWERSNITSQSEEDQTEAVCERFLDSIEGISRKKTSLRELNGMETIVPPTSPPHEQRLRVTTPYKYENPTPYLSVAAENHESWK